MAEVERRMKIVVVCVYTNLWLLQMCIHITASPSPFFCIRFHYYFHLCARKNCQIGVAIARAVFFFFHFINAHNRNRIPLKAIVRSGIERMSIIPSMTATQLSHLCQPACAELRKTYSHTNTHAHTHKFCGEICVFFFGSLVRCASIHTITTMELSCKWIFNWKKRNEIVVTRQFSHIRIRLFSIWHNLQLVTAF